MKSPTHRFDVHAAHPRRKSWPVLFLLGTMLAAAPAMAQETEQLPLSGPTYTYANEAYAAFDRKDYATAIAKVREAIRQRPDVSRLKTLLLLALEASGQVQAAADQARKFIEEGNSDSALVQQSDRLQERLARERTRPALPDPAVAAANQAYRAFNRKDWRNALASAREAIRLAPNDRSYRLLFINTLIAAGKDSQAEAEIGRVLSRFGNDWELSSKRGHLRQKAGRHAGAADDFARALTFAPPGQRRGIQLSLATAANSAGQYRRTLDTLSLAGGNDYGVLMLRAFALQGLDRKEEAEETLGAAIRTAPSPAQRDMALRARIGILADLGHMQEARNLLEQARQGGRLATLPEMDMAYLAVRVGDSGTADTLFRKLDERGELEGKALIDAAYAAKRQFDNRRAVDLFHRAVDADIAEQIELEPQYVFGLRREAADLSRTWGAYSSVIYGGVGVAPGASFAPPSGGNTTQTVQELYWRPPGIGYRNGAVFELFGRSVATLQSNTGNPTGLSTMQGSLGARWKPFPDYNLILEGSRLFPIGGHGRNDILLRTALSFGQGTDLRVDVPSWWMWQGYAEAGRYLQSGSNFANVQVRVGHSIRADAISPKLVFTPLVAVSGSFDSSLATKWAASAGPGFNLRYWFREDKYTAPMSYFDINVEYRFKLDGDDRAKGFFTSITMAY